MNTGEKGGFISDVNREIVSLKTRDGSSLKNDLDVTKTRTSKIPINKEIRPRSTQTTIDSILIKGSSLEEKLRNSEEIEIEYVITVEDNHGSYDNIHKTQVKVKKD